MAKSPYPIDPFLTGIAIGYKNEGYIADVVAPRRTVDRELFEWDEWNVPDRYTVPDTRVGRMSKPNQVVFSAQRRQSATEDFGLDSPVPQKDLDNSDNPQSLLGYITESTMELVMLDREIRVAQTLFNSNSYLASNRATLSGASQISDPTSSPIALINNALDSCLIRPNTMVLGQASWTGLRAHPQIVEAALGTGARAGNASREAVAELFELDQIVVGRGYQNVSRPGQTASYSRLWGKHCALITINPIAQLLGGAQVTTLLTAQFGDRTARQITDEDMGLDGGVRVRAGEKVKEVFVSNLGAYYFQNFVA